MEPVVLQPLDGARQHHRVARPSPGRITAALRLFICHGCPTTREGEHEPPENHTRVPPHSPSLARMPPLVRVGSTAESLSSPPLHYLISCPRSTVLAIDFTASSTPEARTAAARHYGSRLGCPRSEDPVSAELQKYYLIIAVSCSVYTNISKQEFPVSLQFPRYHGVRHFSSKLDRMLPNTVEIMECDIFKRPLFVKICKLYNVYMAVLLNERRRLRRVGWTAAVAELLHGLLQFQGDTTSKVRRRYIEERKEGRGGRAGRGGLDGEPPVATDSGERRRTAYGTAASLRGGSGSLELWELGPLDRMPKVVHIGVICRFGCH
ncbi:uncharacterized protein LOC123412497 isoform X2 [Hordeum vulgare subsp. vulgare]|uniref:uncharacterized protein LOC123412497 isoform X2 n=1 Tax=Hordeum vulgare subsp. vulgare TaxID=112509 RepID=UPI001D1A3563|nr:uncharacterized protein LOC123412497 isoform X2 [Hordeum vulgare subsp. vulgare]